MRWTKDRRSANAGPIARTAWFVVLGLLPLTMVNAQSEPKGWRGQLLAKAEEVRTQTAPAEETERSVKEAIRIMDGMVAAGSNVPAYVQDLADSIAMELHVFVAGVELRDGRPANAVIAYRSALGRAREVPALVGRERDLIDALAQAQGAAGDHAGALRTYDEAVRAAEARKDTGTLRATLLQQGLLCSDLGDHERAIRIQERILAIDKQSGDIQDQIGTELSLSRSFERIGSEQAFAHATSAYRLAEASGQDGSMLAACDLLIRSFQTTDDREQCKTILEQAMAKARERNVPSELARFHDRYGRFQLRTGKPDEALKQFQAGLKVLGYKMPPDPANEENIQGSRPLAELLLDAGKCFKAQGDTVQALQYLLACERLLKASPEVRISPWADLGEIYLQKDEVAKAAELGAKALEDAEEETDKELERQATDLLYRVYKRQGNTKDALDMHERLMAATISQGGEDYKLGLQRSQMRSAYQDSLTQVKIDAEVKKVNAEAKERESNTRIRFLVMGGIALFLAGIIVAFVDRKRRMARFDREAAQLETQALRSQMNPHFIFNALNSINAFVQKNEPDKAASFLSRFARLMRLVLENSRQSEVPLKDDLEALDAYLHLERARSGEKFDYRIEVAADLDPEDVMVPPLVAQPFVENAIWHGMSGKEEKGMITLSVSRKGDQLLFAIEDDGVGRSSPKRMASMGAPDPMGGDGKKTSLGTAITKARLDLVRQQKGKDAGFIYVDLPQGTRVELTLPFSSAA